MRKPQLDVDPPTVTDGALQAKRARRDSRAGFLDAVQAGQETRAVTARIDAIRRANHFGPLIEKSMRPW